MKRNINNTGFTAKVHRQRGAVTLTMSLILLVIIGYALFSVGSAVQVEQKIVNNDVRSRQAFEAGEAGLAAALRYLDEDPDRDNDGNIDPVFDTDGDGIGDSNVASIDASSVRITTTDLSVPEMISIRIVAQGFSDDASATRSISQVGVRPDPIPNVPNNPFISRNSVVINGSATVINPEGNSTIWSGSDVDLGSNNSTATEVADPFDPSYPGCMDTSLTCNTITSSNKLIVGTDVVEYDTSLKNMTEAELFENFFGMPPTRFLASMVTLETTAATADGDVQNAGHEVIWVEGDTTFVQNTTVGCSVDVTGGNICPDNNLEPSIMVINGDLTLSGTPHFYGIVFVIGAVDITGNTTVYGSLITSGILTNSTGGSLDIIYSSDILERTRSNAPMVALSGSWRDFQ